MQYQSMVQLYTQKVMQQEMNRQVGLLPEQVIVVDRPGTLLALAPVLQHKLVLLVPNQQEADFLIQSLQEYAVPDFAYVSLAVIGGDSYQVSLDLQTAGGCCFVMHDHTYTQYRRNQRQVDVYVHFVVERYRRAAIP